MSLNLQNRPKLQPSKFRLSAYNRTNILVKGCCILILPITSPLCQCRKKLRLPSLKLQLPSLILPVN